MVSRGIFAFCFKYFRFYSFILLILDNQLMTCGAPDQKKASTVKVVGDIFTAAEKIASPFRVDVILLEEATLSLKKKIYSQGVIGVALPPY
jgi:hypothetical protein